MEHETLISIAILVSNLEIKSCKFIFLSLCISLSLAVAVLLLAIFPRNHTLAVVTILDNLFLSPWFVPSCCTATPLRGRRLLSIWSGDFLICSQDVCAWPLLLLLPESLCFLIRRSVSEKQDAQSTHRPHKQTMMISRSWRYAPLVGQSQNYKLPSAGGGGGLLVPRIDDKSPPDRAGGVHIIKAPVLLCRSWSFRSPCHYRPHSHSLQRGFCTKTVAIK